MKLCTPAMVYFGLACISILFGVMHLSARSLVAKGIYALIWTWLLNFICEKGYTTVSWFLVILPFVMMFGMVALVLDMVTPSHTTQQTQSTQQSPSNQQATQVHHPFR